MSVQQTRWVERKFEFGKPVGVFPCVLERFRGTPARLEELVGDCRPDLLTRRRDGAWSIQEHAGHLFDLEELGERRLGEYLARVPILSAADMGNRKTYDANHNALPLVAILIDFRTARMDLVRKLGQLDEAQVALTSLHPRLNTPMSVVDWVFFMAEHDDHHLARISGLIRTG